MLKDLANVQHLENIKSQGRTSEKERIMKSEILSPEEQKILKYINPKKYQNEDLHKQLNHCVKEKLLNCEPVTTALMISHILELDP